MSHPILEEEISPFTKKSIAILVFAFLVLFYKIKPYEPFHNSHSALDTIFTLYFWIFNQTLGMIHEAGHGVCYLLNCPDIITALNGSIFQVGFPFLVAFYYKKKDMTFSYLIALFFVGFSLQYVSWYMSTAHISSIIYAKDSFLGVDGYHDFNKIFSILGVLEWNLLISGIVKFFAYALMIGASITMLFLAFLVEPKK